MRPVLLAGASASGKSTLARALCFGGGRFHLSTSSLLRGLTGIQSSAELYHAGQKLDRDNPSWLYQVVTREMSRTSVVVDSVRSHEQHSSFPLDAVRVNVVADADVVSRRHVERGTREPIPNPFMFNRPDFVWNSSRMSLSDAVSAINQVSGAGYVDTIIGGQFGSEGKGKLAALIAPYYSLLLRSGGPNAGHWVRNEAYEFCFHHLPSGTLANRSAQVIIAAGATVYPSTFWGEVERTACMERLHIDRNVVLINDWDRKREAELLGLVGSTTQGVGSAQSRRVLRGLEHRVDLARDEPVFGGFTRNTSDFVHRSVSAGQRALIEGTQGSQLSIFHGEYPYVTSRDTNVSGLLSECGVPPSSVRDTWMVVRSFPIRVGGNSGPMEGEISWEEVARRIGRDSEELKLRELTSTTKRQRRVGEFSWSQFLRSVEINRPTKLFLTFADYINPAAAGVRDFGKLPDDVLSFVAELEQRSAVPVLGISTGPMQVDTCVRSGFYAA